MPVNYEIKIHFSCNYARFYPRKCDNKLFTVTGFCGDIDYFIINKKVII